MKPREMLYMNARRIMDIQIKSPPVPERNQDLPSRDCGYLPYLVLGLVICRSILFSRKRGVD